MANSRLKDYFDLHALALEGAIDSKLLGDAIARTFDRRQTPLPDSLPVGLTTEFADDATKQTQWRAFLDRNGLTGPSLNDVVSSIGKFVLGPLAHARRGSAA